MGLNYIFLLLLLTSTSWALDIKKLANNKEATSHHVTEAMRDEASNWVSKNGPREALRVRARDTLSKALNKIERLNARCDINMDFLLVTEGEASGLIKTSEDYHHYLVFLRTENIIDDIFYRLMVDAHQLRKDLNHPEGGWPIRPLNTVNDLNREMDVEKLYANFKSFPNELGQCSIGQYKAIAWSFNWKNKAARDRQLKRLDYLALQEGVIDLETHHKLEVIRRSGALDWPVGINRYLDVVINAKDKITTTSAPSEFSTKYADRKEKITQRTRLYRNFDSTQVMLLSDILQKQAKRMDARHVSINWRFTDEDNSETDIYVLSPMERYRLSIKMLKKDMAEAMRSELFQGTSIEYEDLVAAAFETGFIKSEELEQVLKFEEIWNPKVEKWRAYSNFAFQLAGSATFFLPPPWNVVGALALVITQTQLANGKPQADPDDSWNSIL